MSTLPQALELLTFWLTKLHRPMGILQPGLSREDILSATQSLPIQLSEEVIEWFMWCNGIRSNREDFSGDLTLFPMGYPLALEEAIKDYDYFHKDPDQWFALGAPDNFSCWFPLITNAGSDFYFADCTDNTSPKSPIMMWVVDIDELTEISPVVYNSLTDMMLTTAKCYESEAYFIAEDGSVQADALKEALISQELNPGVAYWPKWIELYRSYIDRLKGKPS